MFYFFKQKTAYEMRISDWSSDVCSSDLTWADVLDLLERDPMECAEILDWPAKLRLLEGLRHRENLGWSAPRLNLVDLQYSDVRLDKGLYNRLVARGSMKRLVTEQQEIDADDNTATATRA